MESTHKSAIQYSKPSVKRLGAITYVWRKLAPLRALIFVVTFDLSISLGFIIFFSWYFGFGKRVVLLHLSVVSGLIAATTLCLGSLLLFRRIREWSLAKFALGLIPATGFSVLVLLYFADYVSNSMWGNNITYELVSQYVFKGGIFQKELRLLPLKTYLSVAGGLVVILSIHLRLIGPLFRSLEELFLPGREMSMFRDRQRARRSAVGLVMGLLLVGLLGFQSARVKPPYRNRTLFREPIIGLFLNPDGFVDYTGIQTMVAAEERRVRTSYPSGQSFKKRNVVIIMVDALRPDHMQVYGYERPTTPFLDSLLKTGHLRKVELATAVCADTNCGVHGTLSSHTFERQTSENFKLQDLLHDLGYNTYFILASNHSWYGLKESYGTSITYFFDGTNSARYGWSDDRVILEGLEKVPDFSDTPAFFYFHLVSTHSVGVKQEEYVKYLPAKNWGEFESNNREYNASSVINDYDNGVTQADGMIERIFDSLKQKGYLDKSLVVVLSDHGEGLGQVDHSIYGHVSYLYQEAIRIPLLIYDDPDTKYENLEYASQIDVAPTVLDRLGLSIPSSWQGQSLLRSNTRQYSFHQTGTSRPSYAVIYRANGAIYKYLRSYGWGEELYELMSDPHEKHNLMDIADSAIIENMRARLAQNLSDYWKIYFQPKSAE